MLDIIPMHSVCTNKEDFATSLDHIFLIPYKGFVLHRTEKRGLLCLNEIIEI